MASLHKLLSEEGFQNRKPNKKVKFKDTSGQQDSIALPIYICHDRKSFNSSSHQRPEKARSFRAFSGGSGSERSATPRRDEPAIDDVAIKAMIAILSGYAGQYLRDKNFRLSIKEKCRCCYQRRKQKPSDDEIFSQMEMGIQSIENMVESSDVDRVMDLESLQKSIKILNIVASLDSSNTLTNDSSCRKTNSLISACAHLYLSIIYKIAKNDKISARHLLQVFSESPYFARKHLLPEFWDHFFLPHLLHLKIWYNKELDFLANSGYSDREKRIKALNQQYNELMDIGTTQFADYYKEWLQVGTQAPPIPTVPLPSKRAYSRSRRKSSESSTSYHSASSKSLYEAVFGPMVKGGSMGSDSGHGASRNILDLDVEENIYCAEEDFSVEKKAVTHRRSSSLSYRIQKPDLLPDNKKTDYLRFLGCRTEPVECFIQRSNVSKNDENAHLNETARGRAIATICSSESLTDCEMAIRTVGEAWLNSNGDPEIEASFSRASVIQGILEVLYVSNDDEILELAVSILAEIATKSEVNRQCVLSSDPNLDVLTRLMRSSSLFLKAAALLYVVKPKAKQMVSMEWVPLVLRVLEYGDQLQTLFSVKCSPYEAAYYLLSHLLTGFDEDKNFENARQLVSLGGLSLLVRRMDVGDISDKSKAVSVLCYCIRADGSCRHYLVKNLKKEAILSLLVMEKQKNSHGHALELLTELLCLSRRNQRVEYLTGLAKGWESINALQILLLCLQRARPEEGPIIAVILLQLDLMGDPFEYSVYREEAIDALVKALDCWVFNEKIQEQSARALLIMGGHFCYTGEPDIEKWLLKKAQVQENTDNSFYGHLNLNEEDKRSENWQRKTAVVLFNSGNTRLLSVLSDSIAKSVPRLARASLVTVCWMSSYLHSHGDKDFQLASCSILVPQLIECLNDNASNLEEKILATFSLHGLTKGTDYLSRTCRLEKEVLSCLDKLSRVTWTAKELISFMTTSLTDQFL